MKSFKILTLAFTALMGSAIAQKQDEIISKRIDAIGGKDNWNKVKSMRSEASMKANGATKNQCS